MTHTTRDPPAARLFRPVRVVAAARVIRPARLVGAAGVTDGTGWRWRSGGVTGRGRRSCRPTGRPCGAAAAPRPARPRIGTPKLASRPVTGSTPGA